MRQRPPLRPPRALRRYELGLEGGYGNNTLSELRNRWLKYICFDAATLPLSVAAAILQYLQRGGDAERAWLSGWRGATKLVSGHQVAGARRAATLEVRRFLSLPRHASSWLPLVLMRGP